MEPPSVDIKDLLEDESSLGLTFQTNLFISSEPPEPNDCVTIFDTPGWSDDMALDKNNIEMPSVQILVRNDSYVDGWSMISGIKDFLHGKSGETVNGAYYMSMLSAGSPFSMGKDDRNRFHFVWNVDMKRR